MYEASMITRILLYSTLGLLLDAVGLTYQDTGFWLFVAVFWAVETQARTELIEELQAELELMRKEHNLKDKSND